MPLPCGFSLVERRNKAKEKEGTRERHGYEKHKQTNYGTSIMNHVPCDFEYPSPQGNEIPSSHHYSFANLSFSSFHVSAGRSSSWTFSAAFLWEVPHSAVPLPCKAHLGQLKQIVSLLDVQSPVPKNWRTKPTLCKEKLFQNSNFAESITANSIVVAK